MRGDGATSRGPWPHPPASLQPQGQALRSCARWDPASGIRRVKASLGASPQGWLVGRVLQVRKVNTGPPAATLGGEYEGRAPAPRQFLVLLLSTQEGRCGENPGARAGRNRCESRGARVTAAEPSAFPEALHPPPSRGPCRKARSQASSGKLDAGEKLLPWPAAQGRCLILRTRGSHPAPCF